MSIELQNTPKQVFKVNVCRLCSHIRDKVLPIFDNAGSKVDVKIKECFPYLNIRKDDSKPQHICIDCITKLNMFNEFLQVCIESECKFDTYLKQIMEQESMLMSPIIQSNLAECSQLQEHLMKNTQCQSLQSKNDLIVLSEIKATDQNPPVQNFVVMVELKYQDKKQTDIVSNNSSCILHDISSDPVNGASPTLKTLTKDLKTGDYISSTGPCLNDLNIASLQGQKEKKIFPCIVCGRTFSRKTRLNSHMARHTSVKPHKCDKCGKAFAIHSDLISHKYTHTNNYKCLDCPKSFPTKTKLTRHSRIHTKERPFSCSDCGKSFGDKRNLVNHIRNHTGYKPYSCTMCDKKFGVRSHLKAHLSVHSNTPRFNCSLCSKSFKWKTNYNRHIKTHTKDGVQKE